MEKQIITKDENKKDNTVKVPILKVRFMTDDEWNILAYKKMLERNGVVN